MTARIPLSPLDQALFHFDQGSTPWSCHFEVRVAGRLDDERLAAAAVAAASRHPMARARLVPYRRRDRRLYWEIPDRVDHVPLAVVDCHDDTDLDDARSRLISQRVDLLAGPPFALALAHRPGGDSLIMNLSHVAGDGTSGILLLRSIARAYAGLDDGSPQASPTEVRELQAELAGRPKRTGKRDKRPKPTALVGVTGGRPGVIGSGFGQLHFDVAETADIRGRRRDAATLNDVLLGSLAVAIRRFNDERGQAPAPVSLLMPIDLRHPGRAEQIMSNVFFSVSVPILLDEQSDLPSAQAALAPRTQLIKSRRLGGDLIYVPSIFGRWPLGILHSLARVLLALAARMTSGADAAVITNMGRVDPPIDFGADAGPATELLITPPVQMPPGIGIVAATMNDELFIGLRHGFQQFDSQGAAAFLETWRAVLLAG